MRSTLEAGRPAWTICEEGMAGDADASTWTQGPLIRRLGNGGWRRLDR
jgi:hypothetical protein